MADSEAVAKMKVLESEKRMAEAIDNLRRFRTLSLEEMADFVMAYVPTSSIKETMLTNIIQAKSDGGMLDPQDYVTLELQLRMLIPQKFEVMDSLSALGSTRVPPEMYGYETWHYVNPNILVANFGERCFGYIAGNPNMGKTNIGCLILEEWAKLGKLTIGNIGMTKEPGIDYHHVSKISALLRLGAEAALRGEPWIFIGDEGGLWYLRAEAMRRENRGQDKLARILGKLGGNLVIIEQREGSVPTTIEEFSRNAYYCPNVGKVWLNFEGPKAKVRKKLKDVPRTKLPYDPQDIAYLHYDVDVDKLFQTVSHAEGSSTRQARMILEFLKRERPVWESACDLVCGEGRTQKQAAEVLGIAQSTVSVYLQSHPCKHRT